MKPRCTEHLPIGIRSRSVIHSLVKYVDESVLAKT